VEGHDEVEEKGKGSCSWWEKEMDKEQMRAAKARLVAQMQAGQSWHVAAATVGLPTSQSTAYRLCQAVRERGEVALQDGRQVISNGAVGHLHQLLYSLKWWSVERS